MSTPILIHKLLPVHTVLQFSPDAYSGDGPTNSLPSREECNIKPKLSGIGEAFQYPLIILLGELQIPCYITSLVTRSNSEEYVLGRNVG